MRIDIRMAWRNIWRNPRRTLLTTAAIGFACMVLVFMLSFQFGSYETMINASVRSSTGHIQIQAPGYRKDREMRLVVSNQDRLASILKDTRGITAWTFRANGFSLVSSDRRTCGVLVTGVDPATETMVSTRKQVIREGRYLAPDDRNTAIIGKLLSRRLKVSIGDELALLGQGRDGSVAATVATITGIFQTGIDVVDRSTLEIPLSDFQAVYQMQGAVHEIVILVDTLAQVPQVKQALQDRIQVANPDGSLALLDWMELTPGLVESIEMDLVSGMIMYVILILVVAFSILNTFLMSIFERTREFGVLMAVGVRPGRLVRLVMIESVSLTAVGLLVGVGLGCLITLFFQTHGIDMSAAGEIMRQYGLPERIHPRLSFASATIGPSIVLVITLGAALFPALQIRRLRPVEAMRHV